MSLPANMAAQAATRSTTWARCAKLVSNDGNIIGITEHDKPLSIDLGDGDGSITYTPADAVDFTDDRTAADLAAHSMEVIGALDSARITAADMHGGRYEGGTVTLFEVEWQNPASGQRIRFLGPIGAVETGGPEFVYEVKSTSAFLHRVISQTIGQDCRKSFGSTTLTERFPNTPCGVNLAPAAWAATTAYTAFLAGDRLVGDRVKPTVATGWWFRCTVAGTSGGSEPTWPTTVDATVTDGGVTWAAERALAWPGTVSVVTGQMNFDATGITVAADFFARGYVEWLTGTNATKGVKSPVAADDGAGNIRLYRPPLDTIGVGDTFTIFAGCDKSQADCIVFNNWINHNGFPYVPSRLIA